MNVSVLQQFLHNLILPLQASAAPAQTIAGLERACQGLEPFRDKDVGAFADFLTRAADYERDGKWPAANPPIVGRVVDEPSARDYAHRLQTFLEREAPSGSPLSDNARAELKRLEKRLKLAQIKDIATELQIEDGFRGAKQGLDKIVFRLSGQHLSGKKPRTPRKATTTDPAAIQQYAAELRNPTGSDALEQRVQELVAKLSVPNLKALAESLGATGKARRKEGWNAILLSALRSSPTEGTTATEAENRDNSAEDGKVARWAEIVAALKTKADGPDAPHDEIDAELQSLAEQMDRDESIAVAKRIGVVRHLNSRNEALEEIRRKVFEMKRARESIAY